MATGNSDDGFDMEQYKNELDSIVAEVVPSKDDPLAGN